MCTRGRLRASLRLCPSSHKEVLSFISLPPESPLPYAYAQTSRSSPFLQVRRASASSSAPHNPPDAHQTQVLLHSQTWLPLLQSPCMRRTCRSRSEEHTSELQSQFHLLF